LQWQTAALLVRCVERVRGSASVAMAHELVGHAVLPASCSRGRLWLVSADPAVVGLAVNGRCRSPRPVLVLSAGSNPRGTLHFVQRQLWSSIVQRVRRWQRCCLIDLRVCVRGCWSCCVWAGMHLTAHHTCWQKRLRILLFSKPQSLVAAGGALEEAACHGSLSAAALLGDKGR